MTIKKVTGQRILRFAAIADTHLGPVDGVSPSPWLTNRHASSGCVMLSSVSTG